MIKLKKLLMMIILILNYNIYIYMDDLKHDLKRSWRDFRGLPSSEDYDSVYSYDSPSEEPRPDPKKKKRKTESDNVKHLLDELHFTPNDIYNVINILLGEKKIPNFRGPEARQKLNEFEKTFKNEEVPGELPGELPGEVPGEFPDNFMKLMEDINYRFYSLPIPLQLENLKTCLDNINLDGIDSEIKKIVYLLKSKIVRGKIYRPKGTHPRFQDIHFSKLQDIIEQICHSNQDSLACKSINSGRKRYEKKKKLTKKHKKKKKKLTKKHKKKKK